MTWFFRWRPQRPTVNEVLSKYAGMTWDEFARISSMDELRVVVGALLEEGRSVHVR